MYDDELMDAMTEEQMDYEDKAAMQSWAEFYRGDYDDYYEDWDRYEVGFDPYMGCYSDDC